MKIITIIGARPQFIKVAPVSRAIYKYNNKIGGNRKPIAEIIVHTGQHFDANMSDIFFKELGIPKPDYNLGVNSISHGAMTGRMLEKIEEVLIKEKPDWVLVYGDTNSTLAGALSAVKLHISVAHVESGLRSYNRQMPEEYNRVISDHCSDILFCPTKKAVENLKSEGIINSQPSSGKTSHSCRQPLAVKNRVLRRVVLVGDVMYDSVLYNIRLTKKRSETLKLLNLEPKSYILATVHRSENTDNPKRLKSIFQAFEQIERQGIKMIIPIHPRTQKRLADLRLKFLSLKFIPPVGYLDMLLLEKNARIILTDSGGMQKEAYWFGVPCVTLREESEWVETVMSGWNVVVGTDYKKIIDIINSFKVPEDRPNFYGDGQAAEKIVQELVR